MKRFESVSMLARIACGCLAIALLFAGCTANREMRVIPDGRGGAALYFPAGVKLTTDDLKTVARESAQSLLNSDVLQNAAHSPAVLALGHFTNKTPENLEMSLLTDGIRVALLKTGKVVVNQTEDDEVVHPLQRPDFTLTGSLVEMSARSGDIKQVDYSFSFSLANSNGLTVWAETKEISKIARRSNMGF